MTNPTHPETSQEGEIAELRAENERLRGFIQSVVDEDDRIIWGESYEYVIFRDNVMCALDKYYLAAP